MKKIGVIHSYGIKPNDLHKKVTSDFDTKKETYQLLHKLLPNKVSIMHIANDFGELDMFLKYIPS